MRNSKPKMKSGYALYPRKLFSKQHLLLICCALLINISFGQAPVITNETTSISSKVGTSFGYSITASNSPTSYSINGSLPAGLNLNQSSGLISGTPTVSGNFDVTLNATNAVGTGTKSTTITILPAVPVISGSVVVTATLGTSFSYNIIASNIPTAYTATNLPAGLNLNATTGLISGKPTASGNFNVTLTASNAGGTAAKTLVIVTNHN
jgi:hypothetical protein